MEFNHCDHDLPTGFDMVTKALRGAIEKLEQLQRSADKTESVRDVEDSIRTAIGVMKAEIDKGNKDRLNASSKL